MTDLEALRNPSIWADEIVLPVRRHKDGKLQCGTICKEDTTKVFNINISDVLNQGLTFSDLDDTFWCYTYESEEDLLQDGWEIE